MSREFSTCGNVITIDRQVFYADKTPINKIARLYDLLARGCRCQFIMIDATKPQKTLG